MGKFAAGLIMVATAILISAGPSRARPSYEGPWCLVYDVGFDFVQEDCSMPSFEACRNERALWGSTAFCRQNQRYPGYWAKPEPQPHHRKSRQRHHRR